MPPRFELHLIHEMPAIEQLRQAVANRNLRQFLVRVLQFKYQADDQVTRDGRDHQRNDCRDHERNRKVLTIRT